MDFTSIKQGISLKRLFKMLTKFHLRFLWNFWYLVFIVNCIARAQAPWCFFNNPFFRHFFNQNIGFLNIFLHDRLTSEQLSISLKSKCKNISSTMCCKPGFCIMTSIFFLKMKASAKEFLIFLFLDSSLIEKLASNFNFPQNINVKCQMMFLDSFYSKNWVSRCVKIKASQLSYKI